MLVYTIKMSSDAILPELLKQNNRSLQVPLLFSLSLLTTGSLRLSTSAREQ